MEKSIEKLMTPEVMVHMLNTRRRDIFDLFDLVQANMSINKGMFQNPVPELQYHVNDIPAIEEMMLKVRRNIETMERQLQMLVELSNATVEIGAMHGIEMETKK